MHCMRELRVHRRTASVTQPWGLPSERGVASKAVVKAKRSALTLACCAYAMRSAHVDLQSGALDELGRG